MTSVYFDRRISDNERRAGLYRGDLYLYTRSAATEQLVQLARELSEDAFAPYHPTEAQHHLTVDEYNDVLKELKPAFIHHPRCKEIIPQILAEFGCDLERVFFDVPRLRTATAGDYLSSGLAYAFKPHRDTWYSPPMCQLNWWLPVYEIEADNGMAFYPQYWDRPVRNSSCEWNYQLWNETGRRQASQQGTKDTRRQSEALETLELDPDLRLVTPPGGLMIFPAAHLHGTVPNTTDRTRFSIDFRTVHLDELETDTGAPNLDCACTGTTIRDYICGADLSSVPEHIIAWYEESTKPRLETPLSESVAVDGAPDTTSVSSR